MRGNADGHLPLCGKKKIIAILQAGDRFVILGVRSISRYKKELYEEESRM